VKFGFARLIPDRSNYRKWLVGTKLCQIISWKIRLWKWSLARLFCENQIVKAKLCQFDIWILYCISVVLLGKLFRIKTCLWLNSISVYLLYKSRSSQLVYFLQPLKVLPSSAYHLGRPYNRWAMLPFMPQWSQHIWVRVTWIFSILVYTWCTPVSVRHVGYISL